MSASIKWRQPIEAGTLEYDDGNHNTLVLYTKESGLVVEAKDEDDGETVSVLIDPDHIQQLIEYLEEAQRDLAGEEMSHG